MNTKIVLLIVVVTNVFVGAMALYVGSVAMDIDRAQERRVLISRLAIRASERMQQKAWTDALVISKLELEARQATDQQSLPWFQPLLVYVDHWLTRDMVSADEKKADTALGDKLARQRIGDATRCLTAGC